MKELFGRVTALLCLLVIADSAVAELADDLADLEGYTIILSTKIEKWIDKDGEKSGDSFEGCDFDRIIIFSNDKMLICRTYDYTYAYRPTAVILSNGSSFKMIVRDRVYDMRN